MPPNVWYHKGTLWTKCIIKNNGMGHGVDENRESKNLSLYKVPKTELDIRQSYP